MTKFEQQKYFKKIKKNNNNSVFLSFFFVNFLILPFCFNNTFIIKLLNGKHSTYFSRIASFFYSRCKQIFSLIFFQFFILLTDKKRIEIEKLEQFNNHLFDCFSQFDNQQLIINSIFFSINVFLCTYIFVNKIFNLRQLQVSTFFLRLIKSFFSFKIIKHIFYYLFNIILIESFILISIYTVVFLNRHNYLSNNNNVNGYVTTMIKKITG